MLGLLRVLDLNGVEVQLSAPKLRTLLALLLVSRGRPVSVDRIADALWDDGPPRSAPNLVQGYIRDLRRRLGRQEITRVPGGYRLDVKRESVDADRFEDLVRARRYDEAQALWHGPALAEWADQPWARADAARLEEMRLTAVEACLAQAVDAGRGSEVLAELSALVEDHPLREGLHVLLVKALYAAGRQADALAAYTRARRYLADEVGLEPGPELRAVEAAVLAQDPTLMAAPTRTAAPPPAPVTSLVGRDGELGTLRSALAMSRLVTLTGPGGIGKSRLAVEVASAPQLFGAVWFVDLAPLLDSSAVATSVARALLLAESPGLEIDLLCDYLSRRRGLLVLDTCEHVVEAVAELATHLLSRCPDLRILATTRQPLRAPGEQIVPLRGLMRLLQALSCSHRGPRRRTLRRSLTRTGCRPSSKGWMGFRWRLSWLPPGSPRFRWSSSSRAWLGRSTRSRVTRSRVTRGIAPCGRSSAGATTSWTYGIGRHSPHCRCS